jgi:hypothetical protein
MVAEAEIEVIEAEEIAELPEAQDRVEIRKKNRQKRGEIKWDIKIVDKTAKVM